MENTSLQNARDEDIVALCQQGKSEVFDILVGRYMEKAYRIALDFTHDPEDAKDLSQDAFLRAFSRIKQFDGRSTFYTWFYRLVVNICLDYVRRKKKVVWERLEWAPDEGVERRELMDTVSAPDAMAIAGEEARGAKSAATSASLSAAFSVVLSPA